MTAAFVQFFVSAAFVAGAGVILTRCADRIAEVTGLGGLLAGSIFLAAATSLPELSANLHAVWLGQPDLAIGDIMGSSLFNLLILAMAYRHKDRLFTSLAAAHALSATMTITLTCLVCMAIVAKLGATVLSVSVFSWAVLISYLLGQRLVYYDQRRAFEISAAAAKEAKRKDLEGKDAAREGGEDGEKPGTPGIRTRAAALSFFGYAASAGVIWFAAPYLAGSADQLAVLTGIGHTFAGTTLVAFSTSLPELVATITALRMSSYDLALGNIFGSNSFNMAMVMPLDLAFNGSILAAVQPLHAVSGMTVILVTTVVVLSQLYRVEKRRRFIEPDAELIILLIVGSMVLLYQLR